MLVGTGWHPKTGNATQAVGMGEFLVVRVGARRRQAGWHHASGLLAADVPRGHWEASVGLGGAGGGESRRKGATRSMGGYRPVHEAGTGPGREHRRWRRETFAADGLGAREHPGGSLR